MYVQRMYYSATYYQFRASSQNSPEQLTTFSQLGPHATGEHQLPETLAKFQKMVGTPSLHRAVSSQRDNS